MIPDAILSRMAKLFLLLSAALVFGVIYGIATHDRILLLLSIALAVAGGIKIALLFLSAPKSFCVLKCPYLIVRQGFPRIRAGHGPAAGGQIWVGFRIWALHMTDKGDIFFLLSVKPCP